MEIKVSLALETALEFISEVATCKEQEYREKRQLAHSFVGSLDGIIEEVEMNALEECLAKVKTIRRMIVIRKNLGR